MLENIKLLLGITTGDKDALLSLLIRQAEDELETLAHRNDFENLENIIVKMVIYRYNLLGAEGVSGESYNGVSFSYITEYPDDIKRMIYAKRKIQTV